MRFPGFSGAWKKNKIDEIFSVNAGGDIDKRHVSQEKDNIFHYPIYANASENKGFYAYSDIYKIEPPAITVAGRGAYIGIAHARNQKFYPIVRLLVLKPKEDLNTHFFEHGINKINLFIESTGVPQLTAPQISNYKISFPTSPEQNKIASFIQVVDKRIQTQNKIIEDYKLLKKGLMQKIFKQELRFKDEQGNLYAGWEEKKLSEFCEINPSNIDLPDSFIYIDLESVTQGQLIKEEMIYKADAPSRAQRFLKDKDILFQMVRPYQRNNYLFVSKNGNYVASTGYAQIRTKENPFFLFYLLHTTQFVNKVIKRCTGTSYPAINSSDLSRIKILMPSSREQQRIASFLSSIDKKIELETEYFENLITQKQYFLQNLFI